MKMPDMDIDTNMFAPCGMNCMVCYKHCYHKKPCAGCLNHEQNKPEHCRKCKIKDCVRESGISYCYECEKYPCLQIKNLERSYRQRYQTSLLSNSEFVKIYGLPAFMAWQKQLYSCPKCGGIISIHDKECSECQEKMKMEKSPVYSDKKGLRQSFSSGIFKLVRGRVFKLEIGYGTMCGKRKG